MKAFLKALFSTKAKISKKVEDYTDNNLDMEAQGRLVIKQLESQISSLSENLVKVKVNLSDNTTKLEKTQVAIYGLEKAAKQAVSLGEDEKAKVILSRLQIHRTTEQAYQSAVEVLTPVAKEQSDNLLEMTSEKDLLQAKLSSMAVQFEAIKLSRSYAGTNNSINPYNFKELELILERAKNTLAAEKEVSAVLDTEKFLAKETTNYSVEAELQKLKDELKTTSKVKK